MVCGQMWAKYNDGKPDHGTRCNDNSPTKIVEVDGVMYSLYSNQNYIYTYEDHTSSTSGSGNYAVAVYAKEGDTRTELAIKSTVQDGGTTYTVVAIGEQFFWYNKTATKLTIPASVRTLETFALEDNKSNLREIVIEDSGDKLECFRTTYSYGAFSWNGGLKKVYIGRELYPVGNSGDYSYAPFYKGDFTALEVTIGSQVSNIYGYTFYCKDEFRIMSIKAMRQDPPTLGDNAFYNVSNTIQVYVSYKSIDAYRADSDWKYFISYVLDTDLCKADALNDLDAEAGQNPSLAVQGVVSDYKNKVNAATSGADVVTILNEGKVAIQLQKAKDDAIDELNAAKTTYPSDAADEIVSTYTGKINAATTTTDVTNEKNAGIQALQDAKTLQDAKAAAIAALNDAKTTYPSDAADGIVSAYTGKINAATTTTDITKEKNEGIQALQDAYNAQIALQNAKEAAISELNAAKTTYPSDAVDEIVSTYTGKINAATTTTDVTKEKNEGIQALKDAKELQEAKEAAISDLNDAKKDYPSDETEDIVRTYTGKINAATTTDAVTTAKNEGIQALAYAAEMPTVLHINFAEGSAPIEKEHFLTASKFTFDEDCNVVLTVNGKSVTYPWDMAGKITLFKGVPTVEFSASKDPESVSDYYTTFYSSLEAYTIPKGVAAYTATLDEGQDGVIHLNEIKDDIIPAETAVVLISESGSFSAYTSDYAISETEEERGILKGTDVEIPVPENCYILSGTSKLGIGLYPWAGNGKKLSANKAYLQLTEASSAKAFTFVFDEETTGIPEVSSKSSAEGKNLYNLNGIRVNDSYKGIVIKNGKKIYQK